MKIGPGGSYQPQSMIYSGTFWYIDDAKTPANKFIVMFDSKNEYTPREESFHLSSLKTTYHSKTTKLGIGFLKVENDSIILLDDNDPRLTDFLLKEDLRHDYDRMQELWTTTINKSDGRKLPVINTIGMTAVEAFSAFMNVKNKTPLRCSTVEWKTAVNDYINI